MKWQPYVAAVGRKATETAKSLEPWMLAYLVPGLGIDPWLTTLILAALLDEMDPDDQQEWREAPLSTWKPVIRARLREWARDAEAPKETPASPFPQREYERPTDEPPTPVNVTPEAPTPADLTQVPPLQLPAAEARTPVGEPVAQTPKEAPSEPGALDAPTAPVIAKPPPPVVPQIPDAAPSGIGGQLPPVSAPPSGAIIPAPPPGLPENIREAWIQAKLRAGEYARGLGNHIDQWTNAVTRETWAGETPVTVPEPEFRRERLAIIREKVAAAVAEGKGPEKLASELGNAIGEWSRNWRRIARTELQGARNEGGVIYAYRTWGAAARVCRVPHRTACARCRELFLDEDGAPRVFTVDDLVANGVNVGRKQADWKATVYPAHPQCALPGQIVTTARGGVPIESVAPGDLVLSDDGSWNRVSGTWSSHYAGPVVRIESERAALRVTPEHPVLDIAGWVNADALQVGQELVYRGPDLGGGSHPSADGTPASGREGVRFALILSGLSCGGVPVTAVDLDGHLFTWDCHVDQEPRDGVARLAVVSGRGHRVEDGALVVRLDLPGAGSNALGDALGRPFGAPHCSVCGERICEALLWGSECLPDQLSIAQGAVLTSSVPEHGVDAAPSRPVQGGYLVYRHHRIEVEADSDLWGQLGVCDGIELVRGDDGSVRGLRLLRGRVGYPVAGLADLHADSFQDLTERLPAAAILPDDRVHALAGLVQGDALVVGDLQLERPSRFDAGFPQCGTDSIQADSVLSPDFGCGETADVELDDLGIGDGRDARFHTNIMPLLDRIRSVSGEHYSGLVHNLSVERRHSYVLNGIVSHNCICDLVVLPPGRKLDADLKMVDA